MNPSDPNTPRSAAVTNEPAGIEAVDLTVSYRGKPAVRDVTLAVRPGKLTALIGPSGCGKSSFLQSLNRLTDLIPGCRVSGRLVMDDRDILDKRLDVATHRREVGMIFQRPNPFPMSILRNVTLALREHGVRDRRQCEQLAEQSLRRVGLWEEVKDRLHHASGELSGGQQQRLCLARALALNPRVLLLDEPCSALDPISGAIIEEQLRTLRGRQTVVIVTHNLAQARRLADDVVMFWYADRIGYVEESGEAEQMFERPASPVTAAYMRAELPPPF